MATRRKKAWLTALVAAVAAAATALVPGAAPLVEVAAAVIGELIVGTEEAPRIVVDDPAPAQPPAKS